MHAHTTHPFPYHTTSSSLLPDFLPSPLKLCADIKTQLFSLYPSGRMSNVLDSSIVQTRTSPDHLTQLKLSHATMSGRLSVATSDVISFLFCELLPVWYGQCLFWGFTSASISFCHLSPWLSLNSIQGSLLAWETYVNIAKASEIDK